jgi:glycosyltransferase involved in cell wall biosynthesis
MKVVHINTFPGGGAAVACIRLHEELLRRGVHSSFICISNDRVPVENSIPIPFKHPTLLQRMSNKAGIPLAAGHIRERLLKKYQPKCEYLGTPYSDYTIESLPAVRDADIINLHWIPRIINYPSFFKKVKKPIVWTIHDVSPFMGCFNYPTDQRNNPQMAAIDRKFMEIKSSVVRHFQYPIHIVSPSVWLLEEAKNRSLIQHFTYHHIPYGIDTERLKHIEPSEARQQLGLPQDTCILLFVCERLETRRKRFDLIQQLAQELSGQNIRLIAIGGGNSDEQTGNISFAGRINSLEKLNLYYAAADYFLIPSEEDNFPNVVLESLFCGTPVISNNAGGMKDIVKDTNGILADGFSVEAVKAHILAHPRSARDYNRSEISAETKKKYDVKIMADRYMEIYQELLKK